MYFKRMLGKTEITVMPRVMKKRIFYCPACAERLYLSPRTKILERGDPDYEKYSRLHGKHIIGKIELTEYDFKCLSRECSAYDKPVSYDEQCVIAEIQKSVGTKILSQEIIEANFEKANEALSRKKKNQCILGAVLGAIGVVLISYYFLKTGNFQIKFYL